MSRKIHLPAALAVAIVSVGLLAGSPTFASGPSSYLVVWAGDWNGSDHSSGDAGGGAGILSVNDAPGPDFLAVIDADPQSATYGHVVDTVPVPGAENEPHHMQYSWRPGQRIYAGGLFTDRTFVFNVDDIGNNNTRLVGVVEPLDTPCGSVPDAYWVLNSGQAYGTYMGGPDVAGDPRCNGGFNNGFAGTPGEIVLINPDATVAGEFPAAGDFNTPHPVDAGRPGACLSNPPLPRPSCANPHGIQAREDLHLMVTSDYAEPRNVPISPLQPLSTNLFRDTVRVWNISNPSDIRRVSVTAMPQGSMAFDPPPSIDSKGVMGIMETSITNCTGAGTPQTGCSGLHKGAFASSMCGGQIWYSGDISTANPMWRQVWDVNAAAAAVDPVFATTRVQGCVGAGWIQTGPDDSLLFQAVIGRQPGSLGPGDPGVPHMIYALDIGSLVSVPANSWRQENDSSLCAIRSTADVFGGGSEANCPSLAGAVGLEDATSGGPHWGAIDNFSLLGGKVTRIAASNYFVARSGIDGNHKVCMINVSPAGALSVDQTFRDEITNTPCVGFNRANWPHGPYGNAKPHSMLFVTP